MKKAALLIPIKFFRNKAGLTMLLQLCNVYDIASITELYGENEKCDIPPHTENPPIEINKGRYQEFVILLDKLTVEQWGKLKGYAKK